VRYDDVDFRGQVDRKRGNRRILAIALGLHLAVPNQAFHAKAR
jgi:hypothetical protein